MRTSSRDRSLTGLSRRRLLALAGVGIVAGACDIGAPDTAPSTGAPGTAAGPPEPYVPPKPVPLATPVSLPAIVINIAGTGALGDSGDGAQASVAEFRSITGVGVGPSGEIYVSDASASKVRRIRPDGIIETFAGTGVRGYSGDGGPAAQAALTDPSRITVDGAGAVFIAELDRIRRVGANGRISTVLGDGRAGAEGDGGPAARARTAGNAGMAIDGDGNLFIAERATHRIRRIDTQGIVSTVAGTGVIGGAGDGGNALIAQLNQPVDVDVDGLGAVLIAELGGNRVRRIAQDGTIDTLAGTGVPGGRGDGGPATEAELNGPQAVMADSDNAVFVGDWNNRRVRRIAPDGRIETVAGSNSGSDESGGPATETRLVLPLDLAPLPGGRLIVVEQGARRLRALKPAPASAAPVEPPVEALVAYVPPAAALALPPPIPAGPIADVFAGRGEPGFDGEGSPRLDALFGSPRGLAIDGQGRLLIADTGNHRIRRIEFDGAVRSIAGTGEPGFAGDGGPAVAAQINRPSDVVVDSAGGILVADAGNFRLRRIDRGGTIATLAGGSQPGSGGDGGPAQDAQLTEPSSLALDGRGSIYIADAPAHRVRVISPRGTISTFAGDGNPGAAGDGGRAVDAQVGFSQRVSIGADGDVYISQLHDGVVRRVRPDGTIGSLPEDPSAGTAGAGSAMAFEAPIGMAADRDGSIYVVESGAGVVTRIDPTGNAEIVAGNPIGQGQPGDPALEVPLFTANDLVIASDGTGFLLEARGLIWRIGATGATPRTPEPAAEPTETPTSTSTPTPTIEIAPNESAEIRDVTLALGLDSEQKPIGPALEFHPGERVNVAVTFANVAAGTRLGIRWLAGDSVQGTFQTDPKPVISLASFGFWFVLPASAPTGPWRLEVLIGTSVGASLDFAVTPGEVREAPPPG